MNYKQFEAFNFWFIYEASDSWKILEKESSKELGTISKFGDIKYQSIDGIDLLDTKDVSKDWDAYKARPEFIVGQHVELDGVEAQEAQHSYETLMQGLILIRAFKNGQNPDSESTSKYVTNIINWIKSTDFYVAPASTIYHESHKHGLLYHTLRVYNCMIDLLQLSVFNTKVDIDSATLCALSHDWCKIGLYEQYKRNVKNEDTGKWEQKDSYRRKSFPHPLGHGTASMFMAMRMFKLTEEEALAIRWHMSMFNVADTEINEYQQACEDYPLVHLIQFADQLSITNYQS